MTRINSVLDRLGNLFVKYIVLFQIFICAISIYLSTRKFEDIYITILIGLAVEIVALSAYLREEFKMLKSPSSDNILGEYNSDDYAKIIDSAYDEIFLCSITNNKFITGCRGEIENALRRRVKINILFCMQCEAPEVYSDLQHTDDAENINKRKTVDTILAKWLKDPEYSKYIEIKEAKGIVPSNFICVDKETNNGFYKHIEMLRGVPIKERPNLIISKDIYPQWFSVYAKYVSTLWENETNPIYSPPRQSSASQSRISSRE